MNNIPAAEDLKKIINKHVGYAEQEIYDAIDEFKQSRIDFAKLHVKEYAHTLLAQIDDTQIREIIRNAYPLTNIK